MRRILLSVALLAGVMAAATPLHSQSPKQGGAAVITFNNDFTTLDPQVGYDLQNYVAMRGIFDRLMDYRGQLAELSADTIKLLDKSLPANWSRANPVDIIGAQAGRRRLGWDVRGAEEIATEGDSRCHWRIDKAIEKPDVHVGGASVGGVAGVRARGFRDRRRTLGSPAAVSFRGAGGL